ncbi:unnamed protein product [Sphagnum jensenii]|uniref:Peptidase A1 domain-containing protein n=1 Tax=Sphagnum jensenii TaxID=128206 RepID=A0ABP0VEH9_9BRYO
MLWQNAQSLGRGTDWGPIKRGDVILGSQTATNIPLQLIDNKFSTMPETCAKRCPDPDPCTSGFNGILGVGLFILDCGNICSDSDDATINPGVYFACDSSGCYNEFQGGALKVSSDNQVTNPVSAFSGGFNNGITITLPSIVESGAASVTTGSLGLGIHSANSVEVYQADENGLIDKKSEDFITEFGNAEFGEASEKSLSFIDSGSNGIYFPSPSLPICSKTNSFYCVDTPLDLVAALLGFNDGTAEATSFQVADAAKLFESGNTAFNNLCGPSSGDFDWGLPFFLVKLFMWESKVNLL